ncbi:MAG: hypothetical protein ACSLFK_06115 [Gemmatimonadaceae bacterium]
MEGTLGPEAAIAVMRRKERELRRVFHEAGALDPSTAQSLADMGLEETRALGRLRRHEVVRESSPGCFYFEEEVWLAVRAARIRMAIMLISAVGLTALVGLYAVAGSR